MSAVSVHMYKCPICDQIVKTLTQCQLKYLINRHLQKHKIEGVKYYKTISKYIKVKTVTYE